MHLSITGTSLERVTHLQSYQLEKSLGRRVNNHLTRNLKIAVLAFSGSPEQNSRSAPTQSECDFQVFIKSVLFSCNVYDVENYPI